MTTLLTRKQVADRLSLSVWKVDELIRSGKLPAIKIDKSTRILESDLEDFVDARPQRASV